MGLRPISYYFGDMGTYMKEFESYQNGKSFDGSKEYLFESLKFFFAKSGTAELFFFTCSLLYILPVFFISKKLFQNYWYYSFIVLIGSFSFWSYGTNGIRQGVATSVFLIGLTSKNNFIKTTFCCFSFLIHKSLLLVCAGFVLVHFVQNTKYYFRGWFFSIVLSLAAGRFFESLFASFSVVDEKSKQYLGDYEAAAEEIVLKVGFRWDFLIYSGFGVFAIWFFMIKKKYQDPIYLKIAHLYLTINAFWILVIRANYSNRIAYLSWFMLGLVIIYPLLKVQFFKNQHVVVGVTIFGYYLVTYLLCIVFPSQ